MTPGATAGPWLGPLAPGWSVAWMEAELWPQPPWPPVLQQLRVPPAAPCPPSSSACPQQLCVPLTAPCPPNSSMCPQQLCVPLAAPCPHSSPVSPLQLHVPPTAPCPQRWARPCELLPWCCPVSPGLQLRQQLVWFVQSPPWDIYFCPVVAVCSIATFPGVHVLLPTRRTAGL